MNAILPNSMLEATRLTREGKLTEASALLQRLLQGEAPAPPRSTASPAAGRLPRIIDVDPETGEGAPGNPFAAGDAGARRIVAYGLRNPFRWAFRPGTSEIWLGDVGSQEWEELDVIPNASDAVAENFGWPCFEGAGPQGGWGGVPQCQTLSSSAMTPARFQYQHGHEIVPGDGCRWGQGSSISGIARHPNVAGPTRIPANGIPAALPRLGPLRLHRRRVLRRPRLSHPPLARGAVRAAELRRETARDGASPARRASRRRGRRRACAAPCRSGP